MKKYVSLLLVIILIIVMPLEIKAASDILINENSLKIENQINELFDERAMLINQGKYDEVEKVENQLSLLGVSKMTTAEVQNRLRGDVETASMEVLASVDTVTWFTSTQEYTYLGEKYIIETMTA